MNQNTIVLAFSSLVLGCFAASWIYKRVKLHRARSWPQQGGQVTSTHIHLEGSGTQQSRYVAEVMYSYQVRGADYYGRIHRTFLMHGAAHKWADSYQDGAPLIIHYNPENVRDSVLFETEQNGVKAAKSA